MHSPPARFYNRSNMLQSLSLLMKEEVSLVKSTPAFTQSATLVQCSWIHTDRIVSDLQPLKVDLNHDCVKTTLDCDV